MVRGGKRGIDWTHRESNNALRNHQPARPLLLTDRDAIDTVDLHALKRIPRRQPNRNLHLHVIDLIPRKHFPRSLGHLDIEFLLIFRGTFLLFGPFGDLVQCISDDERREEFLGPRLYRDARLFGFAVYPPGLRQAGCVFEALVVEIDKEPLHVALRWLVVPLPHIIRTYLKVE